ncbi:MAG: hypothetical protein Q8K68_09795 [Nitrospirota bacterium]|nr:hypothetical protein [Nitrospirota bacterium]
MSNETKEKSEALYSALVSIRNVELTAYWTRYNIQSAINFGLLAATLASSEDSFIGKHITYAAIAGLILTLIWLTFVVKGKELLTGRWERHIRTYEENTHEVKYKLFCEVKKEEDIKSNLLRAWDNLDVLARGLPILCLVAWVNIYVAHM